MTHKAVDPAYYADKRIEPIDVIEAWGLGFHMGSVIKYIARWDEKGSPVEDRVKALNYLHREITGEWLSQDEYARIEAACRAHRG
jgi:hypothetical protein